MQSSYKIIFFILFLFYSYTIAASSVNKIRQLATSSSSEAQKTFDDYLLHIEKEQDLNKRYHITLKTYAFLKHQVDIEKSKNSEHVTRDSMHWASYEISFDIFVKKGKLKQVQKDKLKIKQAIALMWSGSSFSGNSWSEYALTAFYILSLLTDDPEMKNLEEFNIQK